MHKAFSLFELLIVIALSGVMAIFAFNYLNTTTLSVEGIKTKLNSHINLITASVFQCKEYSHIFPIDANGSYANNSLLDTLECNTSTPYPLDGGKGSFIPTPIEGFSEYKATQNTTEFYFSTTALIDSNNDTALQELNSTYSPNQYELTHDTTKAYLKFYISR